MERTPARRRRSRIRRQLENSARGLGESELLRGSEHALRFHAPELRRLDGEITGEMRADRGECALQARARVARAAHNLKRRTAAGRNPAHTQLIRLRMRLGGA